MAKKRRYIKLGILEDEVGLVALIAIPWNFWLTKTEHKNRFKEIIDEKRYTAILLEPRKKKNEINEKYIRDYILKDQLPLFNYSYENWKGLEKMEIIRLEG